MFADTLVGAFMRLDRRKPSGREKDERSLRVLEQLREKLYSEHVPTARRAAFNLSWMQEDGLDILKEALFGRAARRTKAAATYGLRKMQGRMKSMALDVLQQGLGDADRNTHLVCQHALALLSEKGDEKSRSDKVAKIGKVRIREIQRGGGRPRGVYRKGNRRIPSAR
jgi:hypothetical protein